MSPASRRWVVYLHHAADPCQLVVVLVADDGGGGAAENPVEEDEVVAEHDHQTTWHKHQVQGALLHHHHHHLSLALLRLDLCSSSLLSYYQSPTSLCLSGSALFSL